MKTDFSALMDFTTKYKPKRYQKPQQISGDSSNYNSNSPTKGGQENMTFDNKQGTLNFNNSPQTLQNQTASFEQQRFNEPQQYQPQPQKPKPVLGFQKTDVLTIESKM